MKFGPAGCYDLRPIRVLSVDGGHCALWLEPAVTLRALFPAAQLESIRTRDIWWISDLRHCPWQILRFVRFGAEDVRGHFRTSKDFCASLKSEEKVTTQLATYRPAVQNRRPLKIISSTLGFTIGRQEDSCGSMMGESSFQKLEVCDPKVSIGIPRYPNVGSWDHGPRFTGQQYFSPQAAAGGGRCWRWGACEDKDVKDCKDRY